MSRQGPVLGAQGRIKCPRRTSTFMDLQALCRAGKPPKGAQRSRAAAVSRERGAREVAARPARLLARVGGAAGVKVGARAQRPPGCARSARLLGAGTAESGGQ
uniref:Uncharacterized protein n=1 Tax=Rangifer tarandus platyrhynchus TaxID=3082113 RepID=A0ACB0EXW1_RANTA|nr:unnamed protein product [Rangifer tarandus platyrhynchus]